MFWVFIYDFLTHNKGGLTSFRNVANPINYGK